MQSCEPGKDAKAAQALGVASTTSTPSKFKGEAAGRKSNGTVSVTLAAAGKEIRRESVKVVLRETVELQGSRALMPNPEVGLCAAGRGEIRQLPAVAATVLALLQHVQALHPAVSTALAVQQQPPRQRWVPQSKFALQASPGE